jgi:polar amino acid transport system substrate-binding protein
MVRPHSIRLRLLVPLCVLVLLGAACGDDDDDAAAPDDTAAGAQIDTVKNGVLTSCTDFPYAPFEFGDPGSEQGVDVDLINAIADKLDLGAEFRDTDFDGIFAALAAGQCDLVASSVSITEERLENNLFSDGYFEINQSLLVRKGDEATYDDLPALRGKTIGVQSGTTGADFARANATGASIKEFTGADELFVALKAKQIEAVLQDFPVNAYHARTTGETVVSQVFEAAEKEEYGFAFPKSRQDLVDAVNGALEELRSDDTYEEILTKYLGEQEPETSTTTTG